MVTTATPDTDDINYGGEHASPLPELGTEKAIPNAAQGYQSLVALARLMGRKAAVAAIHAGATPAPSAKRKICP